MTHAPGVCALSPNHDPATPNADAPCDPATLGALARRAGQSFRLDECDLLSTAVQRFEAEASLCGVLVYRDRQFVTALGRAAISRNLARAFHRELFLDKPLTRLLEVWDRVALEVPVTAPISEAIARAVARPANQTYDPLVAVGPGDKRVLLDFHQVLSQQCQVLAEALADLERQRRATEAAQREQERLNQQLIEASRQAGMAEVATSVLHNVGNVLNSVNVSATVVADRLRASRVANLGKVVSLLHEHEGDVGAFLQNDERGRQLPGYLGKLAEFLGAEQAAMIQEMQAMGQSLEHIKNIVSAQQSFAKGVLARQKFEMKDVIEDALRINSMALDRHKVRVQRKYGPVPTLEADKHLVMQVLVNLINNAKKAVRDAGQTDRLVTLTLAATEHDGRKWVVVSVADNGVGIAPENLARVFTHGFTTWSDGHGFGLHAAANSARQMDGTLTAASDGPGRGAVFTLELPI